MSKKKKNKKKKLKKKVSLTLLKTGQPIFEPIPLPFLHLLPPIAYKVSSSKITPFLQRQDGIPCDYKLIGLQVEFLNMYNVEEPNLSETWLPLPQLQFAQVYFSDTPSDGESYFLRYGGINDNKLVLSETQAIKLNNEGSLPYHYVKDLQEEIQSMQMSLPNNHDLQQKLDFYKPIGYVYFPIGQLIFLTNFYEELIFSGVQINFGKKLAHNDPNQIEPFPDETFFSLKIEGLKVLGDNERTEELDDTEGADMALGHPCPPKWETFTNTMGPLIEDPVSAANILNNMPEIWESWKLVVHKTWPVIGPQN